MRRCYQDRVSNDDFPPGPPDGALIAGVHTVTSAEGDHFESAVMAHIIGLRLNSYKVGFNNDEGKSIS